MTKKEIVSLSVKLAGIYCLITALTHLSYAVPSVIYSSKKEGFWTIFTSITTCLSILLYFIPFVLLLLFGFYLIFSDKLPSKMASLIIQEEKANSFSFHDIQVLAFSIIGVWLLVNTIPSFFRIIVQIIVQRSDSQRSMNAFLIFQLVSLVLKLALGIYLFLGGKGLADLWQKIHPTTDFETSD